MKAYLFVAFLSCLVACAAPRHVRVSPLFADDPYWSSVSPKPVEGVIVTEGDLKRKYHPIAKITVYSTGTKQELSFERMKEEAAKIGADAVVHITVSTQYAGQGYNAYTKQATGPITRHTLEGTAVVFDGAQ